MSAETRHDDDSDSDDSVVAFANVDFTGVDFTVDNDAQNANLINLENAIAFGDYTELPTVAGLDSSIVDKLVNGDYVGILRSTTLFDNGEKYDNCTTVKQAVQQFVSEYIAKSPASALELEFVAIAALNLFLQANYTGPSLQDIEPNDNTDKECIPLSDINPHDCFKSRLHVDSKQATTVIRDAEEKNDGDNNTSKQITVKRSTPYQNAVLSELAVDGEWPCQVCQGPYFLLLALSILQQQCATNKTDLQAVHLWYARALVAHQRLLAVGTLSDSQPLTSLWNEALQALEKCEQYYSSNSQRMATVMLEKGLAEHHFDRPKKGKKSFLQAQQHSGLQVEVTGATGKRTKFQQVATAQMLVKAVSAERQNGQNNNDTNYNTDSTTAAEKNAIKDQLVQHSEEEILLERIKFDDEKENQTSNLTILDQSIILALCLDVKNSNPADGLTNEEMGAYLACVLDHHNDWMVYSTGLLERSWVEFERSHARERAILQMQALADQHTNRLTITQSTSESIKESAPVQDRLKNLHKIVYPPRWAMIQDLADRYANMGIVTSAAELYTEIELWDDVVECYRRAGRVSVAEEIVRERLKMAETPRMWCALGDLTKDPQHYEKAIELSHGRFSKAYVSLGHYYFDKGDLDKALPNYEQSLKSRPLNPVVWFRVGTISMQLQLWDKALKAFSEVVQQEPEESDAWANVAAIHMRNKSPTEAYPALNESLRYNRNNWRVWVSKLYTCLDLEKYDEAIQASMMILELGKERGVSESVPKIEEKCVRAIIGGALKRLSDGHGDEAALDSARRTLARTHELLDRLGSVQPEPWVFEATAYMHAQVGNDKTVLENLLKEYRSLQRCQGWDKDNGLITKVFRIVSQIVQIYMRDKDGVHSKNYRESLVQAKFLARGAVKTVRTSRPNDPTIPDEVERVEKLLEQVQEALQSL